MDLTATPNLLLAGLSPKDRMMLAPHVHRRPLAVASLLEQGRAPLRRALFIEEGMASVLIGPAGERQTEVAIIGREGMTGLPLVLGGMQWPHTTIVQIAGHALCIEAGALRSALATSPALRDRLNRFAQAFLTQVTENLLAASRASIEQRLARWLVMARERCDGDELFLTHEFLSNMLGVRRAGVTVALHQLEGERLIRSTRGMVRVLDRRGLRRYADGFYGMAAAEYDRLLRVVRPPEEGPDDCHDDTFAEQESQ